MQSDWVSSLDEDVYAVKLGEQLSAAHFCLLEVQYLTEHLRQFGACEISNADYLLQLESAAALERSFQTQC